MESYIYAVNTHTTYDHQATYCVFIVFFHVIV